MKASEKRSTPTSLTVVIPFLNEAETLRPALERLLKADLPLALDVILVDDGSTDNTAETVSDLVSAGRARYIRHPANRGKGAAFRTGLKQANGDLTTILDADLEYDPQDLRLLIDAIAEDGAEVAFGKRSFGAHTAFSFWFVIGNRFVALWASFLFNTWLSDLETCFKMAWTDVWRSLDLKENGFGLEAETAGKILRRGYRIHEVPISYKARGREEGKKLEWSDGFEALWILLRIRLLGK